MAIPNSPINSNLWSYASFQQAVTIFWNTGNNELWFLQQFGQPLLDYEADELQDWLTGSAISDIKAGTADATLTSLWESFLRPYFYLKAAVRVATHTNVAATNKGLVGDSKADNGQWAAKLGSLQDSLNRRHGVAYSAISESQYAAYKSSTFRYPAAPISGLSPYDTPFDYPFYGI